MSGRVGWGSGRWGGTPWGGGRSLATRLVGAVAVGENVLRLQFSKPIYFSGILDRGDASDPSHYAIGVVTGSSGLDGSPTHPVTAVSAALSTTFPPGSYFGCCVDVTTDRPMTPHPSVYSVTGTGLISVSNQPLDTTSATMQFQGAFKEIVPPDAGSAHPARDFANPQTLAALIGDSTGAPTGNPLSTALGSFVVDPTGDYALDSGITALKKRIYRRLMTTPGAFVHLGEGYGVGVAAEGKKLGSAAVIGRVAAKAEAQIALEPEVAQVRVRALADNTGLVRFIILVRTRAGADAKFTALFPVS